ncbi:MAG TPA: helix-turn-helix domain-containing protein [Candidatus Eremiobacteraceae bacterium]
MPGIGLQLTAAREARGMTPNDVAKRLKIRAIFVDALEREDWSAVGEPVYARGFLKNYAKLLGLDSDVAAAEVDVAHPEHALLPDVPAIVHDESSDGYPPSRRADTNWLVIATGVVAAVMLVAVVWNFFGMPGGGPAVGTAALSSPAPSPSAPALIEGSASAAAAPVQTTGVDLRLETTQACWLSVTVDGKRVVYSTLPKGAVREFHAEREINLRAGNAGGLVATIDGKPLGTLGQVGQVQDRVFAVASPAPSRTAIP